MPASASTASRTGQQEQPPEVTPRSVDDPRCDVCSHPVVDHDAIALRFCRATLAAAIARGCVCRPA
ncbi:RGCVC family protein [Geodermatophilus sp. URMC 61]|uniref:RGCVC family protein n=1 Tax=Geodermatophilus sp. URMC 61 TaxID=3423411 RepID=UPI00406D24EA